MKKFIAVAMLALATVFAGAGCSSPADVASANTSKEADQFKVLRRITTINGITDKYLMVIIGYCSLGNADPVHETSITCRIGGAETADVNDDTFKKSFIEKGDNIVTLVEQITPINVSTNHYELIFQPETLVPDIIIP